MSKSICNIAFTFIHFRQVQQDLNIIEHFDAKETLIYSAEYERWIVHSSPRSILKKVQLRNVNYKNK